MTSSRPLLRLSLLLLLLAAAISRPPAGAQTIEIDADRQYRYGSDLLHQQRYTRAITELDRFLHFFPDDPRAPEAMFQIGMAQARNEQYRDAASQFEKLIDAFFAPDRPLDDPATRAFFELSACQMITGDPGAAQITLSNLMLVSTHPPVQDAARYQLSWMQIFRGDWHQARQTLSRITPPHRSRYQSEALSAELARSADIPQKDPVTAGLFSLLPGFGYLYCDRPRDALISFLINGGMIAAAVTAFGQENPALGGLLTLVELGFYSGNIYGSVASAHKYNRNAARAFNRGLRNRFLLTLPREGGIGLLFQASF